MSKIGGHGSQASCGQTGRAATLVKLESLALDNNLISDIKPISNLVLLERLHLKDNNITDYSPIKEFDEKIGIIDFDKCIEVLIDGKEVDLVRQPYLVNETIFVPLKPILNSFGCTYQFEGHTIVISKFDKILSASNYIENKDIIYDLKQPTEIASYFVSLDYLMRAMGIKAYWDAEGRIVFLLDKQRSEYIVNTPNVDGMGNSMGNAHNDSFVAYEGDWIYFVNSDYKLIRYNLKTKERYVLYYGLERLHATGNPMQFINIVGKWIYIFDHSSLFRMLKDGTHMEEIETYNEPKYNVINLIAKGDKFFYNQSGDPGLMYKIEQSDWKVKKFEAFNVQTFDIDGKYIYFSSGFDNIMRINYETNQKEWLFKAPGVNQLIKIDNFIYYSTGARLERVSLDKKEVERMLYLLNENYIRKFNYKNGWIYYTVENQSNKDAYIGKVKTDGTDNTVIRKMDKTVEQSFNNRICVIGDWIFYRIDNKLHMIKVDGTGEQILE